MNCISIMRTSREAIEPITFSRPLYNVRAVLRVQEVLGMLKTGGHVHPTSSHWRKFSFLPLAAEQAILARPLSPVSNCSMNSHQQQTDDLHERTARHISNGVSARTSPPQRPAATPTARPGRDHWMGGFQTAKVRAWKIFGSTITDLEG